VSRNIRAVRLGVALAALPLAVAGQPGPVRLCDPRTVTSLEAVGGSPTHAGRPASSCGDGAAIQDRLSEVAAPSFDGATPASFPPLTVGQVAVDLFADLAVMSPDERLAYVSGHQEQTIAVLDLRTLRVVAQFAVPDKVWGLALSPDGRRLFVSTTPFASPLTDQCSGMFIGAVASELLVLDARSGAVTNRLPLPAQTYTMLVSPDASQLALVSTNSVEILDIAAEAVVATIHAPQGLTILTGAVFAAGGSKIFAGSEGQGVAVFDLADRSAHALTAPAGFRFLGQGMGGVPSLGAVFTSLVDSNSDVALAVIDAATETVRAVPVPSNALGGAFYVHRHSRVFLPSSADVLDAHSLAVVGQLPQFYFGTGLVSRLSPDESVLFVRPVGTPTAELTLYSRAVQYDLLAIDTSSLRVLKHLTLNRKSFNCTRSTPLIGGASGQVWVAPNPAVRTVSVIKQCSPRRPSPACG
jgi:hypothetical protein